MIVIGVDPDSKAHGVAVYVHGCLTVCASMTRLGLMSLIEEYGCDLVSIENVLASNATFAKKGVANHAAFRKVSLSVGRCQQAQQELMNDLQGAGISYILQKPSSAWKKDKKQFERVTGWQGRSNEDTRSAAYFGFIAIGRKV